jgi:Protein of unknown function DUF262
MNSQERTRGQALFQPMEIEPINAAQQSLGKIFSDDYAFTIPTYQRPYSWEESQARELLDDIQSALGDALSTKDPVTYFLGSIVLAYSGSLDSPRGLPRSASLAANASASMATTAWRWNALARAASTSPFKASIGGGSKVPST